MNLQNLHIGTSGWSYYDWREIFYPVDLRSADWLNYYSRYFDTVELNSSFYHLPRKKTTAHWAAEVADDFRFCPKISRYLTHIKKLEEPDESLRLFFDAFEPIKKSLGPVLIQLPASVKFEVAIATTFFKSLKKYKGYKFALEVRHESWLTEEAIALITDNKLSLVISQSGAGYPYIERITAKDVYVRLHGPKELYRSSYSTEMLAAYAGKIKKWLADGHRVWVFFNNTMAGVGLKNAEKLEEIIRGS